jgi:hypothetical protein
MKLSWDPPNMTDMFSQRGVQKRTTGVSSKLMFVDLKQYMRVNRLNLKRVRSIQSYFDGQNSWEK